MAEEDVVLVKAATVGCDGGGGTLGHPMVYLNLGDEGEIVCPYCSRHFRLEDGAEAAGGH